MYYSNLFQNGETCGDIGMDIFHIWYVVSYVLRYYVGNTMVYTMVSIW